MGDETIRMTRSTVLRLRGLPFQATETDIEQFFQGYTLTQCVICRRNGRATGEAYVQLETEALAAKAQTELNCKYVGRRYIEIFEALESDIAGCTPVETKGNSGYVLRLRGLPYSATTADVEHFFDGCGIVKGEEGIVFSVTSLGKPTGEGYVEFIGEEDQSEAMKRHKHHMGSRYIELFKSTKADLLQALQQNMFYKEQAQKRQVMSRTMTALPRMESETPYVAPNQVSDMLRGLNVNERTSLMLSPRYADRTYGAGPRPFLPSSFMNPQYYVPNQTSSRVGMSDYQSGKPYNQQRLPQQGMMQPYMMRPHMIQQPHQIMMPYSRSGWQHEMASSPFPRQYGMQSGLSGSPSGPTPYVHSYGSLPMFEERLDLMGQSTPPPNG